MIWCPRCGTSLSQHELTLDCYRDVTHPSLYVCLAAAPSADGEARRGVDDDAVDAAGQRRRGRQSRRRLRRRRGRRRASTWVMAERASRPCSATARVVAARQGRRARRPAVPRPVRDLPGAGGASTTASSRWDEVGVDEGTGIVHIAPGCGAEDFELGQRPRGCRCSCRSTRPAPSSSGSAAARPHTRTTAPDVVVERPRAAGLLLRAEHARRTATRRAGAAAPSSSSASSTSGSSPRRDPRAA